MAKYAIEMEFLDACRNGDSFKVKYITDRIENNIFLLKHGLDLACIYGHKNIVLLLIISGANITDENLEYCYNKEICLVLIENGSCINYCNVELTEDDIEYLIKNKKIKEYGRYTSIMDEITKRIKYSKNVLQNYIINDLIDIVSDY